MFNFKKIFSNKLLSTKEPIISSIFETHKTKIYPWVKLFSHSVPSTENTVVLNDEDFPVHQAWIDDLSIFYVVDIGDMYQMIQTKELPKNMTIDKLHELALANLRRDIEYRIHENDIGGYSLVGGGDLEATSICLPEVWADISNYINDNLVVAIPAKDLVLIAPESEIDNVSNLKICTFEFFKVGAKQLTKNIFHFHRFTNKWTIIDHVN